MNKNNFPKPSGFILPVVLIVLMVLTLLLFLMVKTSDMQWYLAENHYYNIKSNEVRLSILKQIYNDLLINPIEKQGSMKVADKIYNYRVTFLSEDFCAQLNNRAVKYWQIELSWQNRHRINIYFALPSVNQPNCKKEVRKIHRIFSFVLL